MHVEKPEDTLGVGYADLDVIQRTNAGGWVNGCPLNEEGSDCIEGRLLLFLSNFVERFEDGVVEVPPLQQGAFVFRHRNRGVFADLPVNIVGRSHELDVGSFDEVEAVPHVDDCPDDGRLAEPTRFFAVFGPTQRSGRTFLPKVDTWTKPVMLFQAGVRSFGPVPEALSNRPIAAVVPKHQVPRDRHRNSGYNWPRAS